jgi:ATP-binding cassette subfamily C protein
MIPAILLAVALSLAVQMLLLAVPLLTMHVYDGVMASRSMDTLLALVLVYAVVVVFVALLRALRATLLAAASERWGRVMQLRGLGAAVRCAARGERAAGLAAVQDAQEVRRLAGGGTVGDVLDLAAMPVALALLFLLHPLYGWVGLAGCALLILLGALTDATTRGLVKRAGAAQSRLLADLTGRLRQPDLLDALGMLDPVLRRWRRQQLSTLEIADAAQRRARALGALSAFAGQMQQVALMAAGAWLVTTHRASPGSMMAAALLAGMATAPGARIVAAWRDWSWGSVALRRLNATLVQAAPAAPKPRDAEAPPGLLARGLSVQLPDGRVLVRELDLHLPPGRAMLVTGANGTGKTSLLRALLGLAPPASGAALLDGQDTLAARRGAIGPRIGFLPQGGQLLEGTVAENIGRFTEAPMAEVVAAARTAGAHEMIGRLPVGYASSAGPSAGLSGGQRQLVALSRALHGAPRLLVLDEPEAGLDADGRVAVKQAVARAKADGAAIVLVTHEPKGWDGIADLRLALGKDGAWRLQEAA